MKTQFISTPIRSLRTLRLSLTLAAALLASTMSRAETGSDSTQVQVAHTFVTQNSGHLSVGILNPAQQRYTVQLVTKYGDVVAQSQNNKPSMRYLFPITELPQGQYYLVVKSSSGKQKRAVALSYQPGRIVGSVQAANIEVAER